MRKRKLVSLRTLERSNCLSIQVCTKKGNSFCACQKCRLHLYPFNENNVQRLALWLCTSTFQPCSQFPRVRDRSTFNFSLMRFDFRLFWFEFQKQEDIITLASGVSSHYIVLHPVSSRASRISGILVQFVYHSCLIRYRNISLDFSHLRYFGSFKSIHLLCILILTHLLHFLVG